MKTAALRLFLGSILGAVLVFLAGFTGITNEKTAYSTGKSDTADHQAVFLTVRVNGQELPGGDREGRIRCASFNHSVKSPRDAASGLPTGRRQYEPLRCTKLVDGASVHLVRALTENQRVDATFSFVRSRSDRRPEEYYRIALQGGNVASYEVTQSADGVPMEEISFTFQKIEWTYTDGGVTHEDTWDTQR